MPGCFEASSFALSEERMLGRVCRSLLLLERSQIPLAPGQRERERQMRERTKGNNEDVEKKYFVNRSAPWNVEIILQNVGQIIYVDISCIYCCCCCSMKEAS